jgi:bacterioferritin
MIRHFADDDPTTRVLLEGILKDEEEHATDLTDLLYIVDPASGRTEGQDPGTHPLNLHPEQPAGGGSKKNRRGAQSVQTRPQATSQADATDVEVGAQAGGSRSVHVTKPNRKRRIA